MSCDMGEVPVSSHPSLKHTLTELYLDCMAYPVGEVMDFLRGIDFFALEEAVKDHMGLAFAYTTESWLPKKYNVSTVPLFGQDAALLLSGPHIVCDLDDSGGAVCCRGLELWLREDMTFAVVAHHGVSCLRGRFKADYRVVKDGTPWKCGLKLDLNTLTNLLKAMCAPDQNEIPYRVQEDEAGAYIKDGGPFDSPYIFPYDDMALPSDERDIPGGEADRLRADYGLFIH